MVSSSSWKWRTLGLFVSLAVLVLCALALFSVHVDQYTNISAAEVDAQNERLAAELIKACQQAGGYPQADATTMYCNVSFQWPDDRWYVTPIPNPNYDAWQMFQPLLVVLACSCAIVVCGLLYKHLLCFRTGAKTQ